MLVCMYACFCVCVFPLGSFGGGTPLTIYGSGFAGDEYLGGNEVMIGDRECIIDEFSTEEFRIVCEVPPLKE